jgi:hypothetical protein
MRLFSLGTLVVIALLFATSASAQQPPAFTYYRLPEPSDTSASRAHAVDIDDSGRAMVGGAAVVESTEVATVWMEEPEPTLLAHYLSEMSGFLDIAAARPAMKKKTLHLPTPDATVASRVWANNVQHPDLEGIAAGSWDGGPDRDPLPFIWYGGAYYDSAYEYVQLPTLGGEGIGEARSLCGVQSVFWNPAGWSASTGGVKHAVAWTSDSIQGPYTLEEMGDYGSSYPSQANAVTGIQDGLRWLAVGWAETPAGLMLPQEWQRDTLGTWTHMEMSLPAGAVEGGVNSLESSQLPDGSWRPSTAAAGWCKDTFDHSQAVYWKKIPLVSPSWIPQVLGTLDGYDESAGLAVTVDGYWNPAGLITGTLHGDR